MIEFGGVDRELLFEMVNRQLAEPQEWLDVLSPWEPMGGRPSTNFFEPEKQDELCRGLEERIKPQVTRAALALFKEPRGLNQLFWKEENKAFAYVLLDGGSSLWHDPEWSELVSLLDKAPSDPTVHGNCQIYLVRREKALVHSGESPARELVRSTR